MEAKLTQQLNESGAGAGFYFIRARNLSLGEGHVEYLPKLPRIGYGTAAISLSRFHDAPIFFLLERETEAQELSVILCLFKSEMDAEEYINYWLDPDSWEAQRVWNKRNALRLLKE